ncbi:hypothetical protein [Maliponia aquimaris]|uniref:Uncharacterized protein n=1 Tax=Maliponia aquimaris TaxID=1673631 RepID=A0A238L1F4_9RHOB|nr:hypothetical protein [Maliponia aquimaris]SMX48768.1 hypothetical protein MAA8898_04083 [Maliponia aquimaris]
MICALVVLVMAVALLSRETRKQGYSVIVRGAGTPIFIETTGGD